MEDPRVRPVAEALLKMHIPGKNFFEIHEEIQQVAIREAEVLLKVLDDLRPPDMGTLATRQVERIAAHSRVRQLQDSIEVLKSELEPLTTSPKFKHLESGMLWAIDVLKNKIDI